MSVLYHNISQDCSHVRIVEVGHVIDKQSQIAQGGWPESIRIGRMKLRRPKAGDDPAVESNHETPVARFRIRCQQSSFEEVCITVKGEI